MKKVLLTRIGDGLGRLLCHRLHRDAQVVGVDRVRPRRLPGGVPVHLVDLRKRAFEEVMRSERPDVVIHLAATGRGSDLRGSKRLLDHCADYGVDQLIVLSTAAVYGASPENSYQMTEDSLLAAGRREPEILEAVEVDTLTSTFLWKYPHISTSILRPVTMLGPIAHTLLGRYVRARRVPTVAGFDPMIQFVHEDDLADAVAMVVQKRLQGVYNVVGPGEVPLHTAIRETGGTAWPLPEFALRRAFERFAGWGMWTYSTDLIEYLKYPACLSGARFAEAAEFRCRYGLSEIFDAVRP